MKAVAESPGKVIVMGEHFVVHGAWALAAAIPRRVRVEAAESDRLIVRSTLGHRAGKAPSDPVVALVTRLAERYAFPPRVRLDISSEVPSGEGLGSSAATMVAAASAVSRLKSLRLTAQEVIESAMEGERIVHGNPSGVDVAASALGGVILFKRGAAPRMVPVAGRRALIVTRTGKTRRTNDQIGMVSERKKDLPALFSTFSDAVSRSSADAARMLASGDMEGLGRLLTTGHAVLSWAGASSPELDVQVDALLAEGCYGAKMTGGGGGGSVVAVAPKGKEKRIVAGLGARGFEAMVAGIPVRGVKSWTSR